MKIVPFLSLLRRLMLAPFLLLLLCAARAEEESLDIRGRIVEADGTPVPGAVVFVSTACPRSGSSNVCPSCYADCAKSTRAGRDGTFRVNSVSPNLIFRLLVVATGYQTRYVDNVDPRTVQEPTVVVRLTEEQLKSPSQILGTVLDEAGAPVAGAIIEPSGARVGKTTTYGDMSRFSDPLAATDAQGRFRLSCASSVDSVVATVSGPGLAQQIVALRPGTDKKLKLETGVAVTGGIFKAGHPVAGALVGVVTTDQSAGRFIRSRELATDQHGRFLLPNLTAGREYLFYAKMDSLGGGMVASKRLAAGRTGDEQDLGVLEVEPGHRVAGRIILSDGAAVAKGTKILLGRRDAWDFSEAELDGKGRFVFVGVPTESVALSVWIPGYRFSELNPSLDPLTGGIVGKVAGDCTDLEFLLEPGEFSYNGKPFRGLVPYEEPLRSARPPRSK